MGKREVRIIAVPKGVTITLLIFTTLAMVALFYGLSRHAYSRPTGSTAELIDRVWVSERSGTLSATGFFAALWPVAANVLLFVPWGFLAFVSLDSPQRPRSVTYAMAAVAGIAFAVSLHLWQSFLPMRVTTASDAIANAVGAFCGSIAGHVRKQVRVRFEY
jgi:VanZ family protein